jgi:very-short-patch-repair endonuclease
MSIACKHVDFVLVDAEDLHPVAAIELDDSSHQRADRIKRDALLNNLFAKAEFPLIRFPTAPNYDLARIHHALREIGARNAR